eukprot:CAMPEP_0119319156 /NCGR_PEP_ID=MMETSP1333-20130426/48623_1 /TAXON_ID=418940 /ORGANISM="Scyphosphaera apsteinii, Strain RCC1455" /LENGTH=350 /DNA_ID=CAMNT_0007325499 /DNA_START=130 /DNA_END=1182 /DNA_ORIENTATION=-
MEVPVLSQDCSAAAFRRIYHKFRAVILRPSKTGSGPAFGFSDLQRLHLQTRAGDSTFVSPGSFTLETSSASAPQKETHNRGTAARGSKREAVLCRKRKHTTGSGPTSSSELLGARSIPKSNWYASFIVQGGQALDTLLASIPLVAPPCLSDARARHHRAVWWFIGRNSSRTALAGRPEHTDDIAHDGTWHLQVNGTKEWTIRPTDEWFGTRTTRQSHRGPVRILCEPGDILCLHTGKWWHSTQIPTQSGPDHLSISYARDFVLCDRETGDVVGKSDDEGEEATMTNIDGLFTTSFVHAGTIILTEESMPECELPVSNEPNCEVCESEDGVMCLVATKDIASGENLTIAKD